MKTVLTLPATLSLAGPASSLPAAAPPPNVMVLVTDDQGAADAGCYGAKDVATPRLDARAARGVLFTQFYAAAPGCAPSRAGLLTGRYPLRAGLIGIAASQPGERKPCRARRSPWRRCSSPAAMPPGIDPDES